MFIVYYQCVSVIRVCTFLRIDGSSPDSPTQQRSTETLDRPLTQPNSSESTADNNRGTSPSQPADSLSTSPTQPGKPTAVEWSAVESYADVLKRRGGPQVFGAPELLDLLLNSAGQFKSLSMTPTVKMAAGGDRLLLDRVHLVVIATTADGR